MSGVALETFNPVVFDDPVYCHEKIICMPYHRCSRLFLSICELFRGDNDEMVGLEYDKKEGRFKKCQQCKDHYEKNKNSTINKT